MKFFGNIQQQKTINTQSEFELPTTENQSTIRQVLIDGQKQYATSDQWQQFINAGGRKGNRKLQVAIEETKTRAHDAFKIVTQAKGVFTFQRFEKEFLLNVSSKGFLAFFQDYLERLKSEERIGTYESYSSVFRTFKKFAKDKEIDPVDVTPEFLTGYEKYLASPRVRKVSEKKKIIYTANRTSISIHMRTLRAVYNSMLSYLPALQEHYPFSTKGIKNNRYKIRSGAGKHGDALTIEQLKTFINTEILEGTPEWVAKKFWLFSFFCNGMNMTDIAHLKYSNIHDDCIRYVRRKTKDTEQHEEYIEVPLTETILNIIDELGTLPKLKNRYVFNILQNMNDIMMERKLIKQHTKTTNKYLARICNSNELPKITTYWARHTYASLLKEAGKPVELIREMLGHADIKTTEHYLKRFDLAKKKNANESIINLLK